MTNQERMAIHATMQIKRMARDLTTRPEILIYGAAEWMVKTFATCHKLLLKAKEDGALDYRQREPPFIQRYLLPLLQDSCKALLYLVVVFQPDYFQMTIPQFTFMKTSVDNIYKTARLFVSKVTNTMLMDLFRIRVLFECMDVRSTEFQVLVNPAEYISNPQGMKVEVKNLSYRYHSEGTYVLKDVIFVKS